MFWDVLYFVWFVYLDGFDDLQIVGLQDCYFSYWLYVCGYYEIDDDFWGWCVIVLVNNWVIVVDIEQVLLVIG